RGPDPEARTILLLCDGGGGNPADNSNGVGHGFKAEVQRLAAAGGGGGRGAHHPPPTAQDNPTEHPGLCPPTPACPGGAPPSAALCAELMRKARTRSGLSVVVDIVEKVYRIGAKVSEAAKDAVRIIRDEVLPVWNYRILPNL